MQAISRPPAPKEVVELVDTQVSSPWDDFTVCLPHPYLTKYVVKSIARDPIATAPERQPEQSATSLRLCLAPVSSQLPGHQEPSFSLHSPTLSFDALAAGHAIPVSDNTSWARARRSPSTCFSWTSETTPTVAQIWLLIYSIFTVHHTEETIRLSFAGSKTSVIRQELLTLGLAVHHPLPINRESQSLGWGLLEDQELVLIRSSFWQGAGSPFGVRSAWTPVETPSTRQPLTAFPILPTTQTITTKFPDARIHTLHPIRPAKPTPGSTIYSRWIPHLSEHFSMVALDYTNATHLNLFHEWQNDPRVAAGWNETGTLSEHRHYLQALHNDPHTLTVLAYFDNSPFAYFEVYWGKEDHLGAHYVAGDWDRGRHSLVGDATFLGRHRAHAWWSSLMHYMFLDDPRTEFAVGEPKWSNERVLQLDAEHGFHVEKYVDLPHKRSALVRCSRERFFGLCTVGMPYVGKVKEGRRQKL